MIRIFENIDCMEGMAKYADLLKSRKVLAIVDPPYGIGMDKMRVFDDEKRWDLSRPPKEYFARLRELTLNIIVWGGNYFEELFPCKGFIIWDKHQPEDLTFGMVELAATSFDMPPKMFFTKPAGERGFYTVDCKRIHPTQKPIALYKWLLEKYSAGHDLILDTHVGSASSLIACEDFGIDYVAFELDPDYYRMANERLLKARFEREAKVSETCVTKGLALFE